jgi:hypothetical protein
MTTHIVIIGGSFGGLTAAYRLRGHLEPDQARITLTANDTRIVYIPSLPEHRTGRDQVLSCSGRSTRVMVNPRDPAEARSSTAHNARRNGDFMNVSMNSNRRVDHPRRAVGVGVVVVGAAAAAALTGAGAARADDTGTISATDALGFLDSATTDLTDGKDLLSTAVVPDSLLPTLVAETRLVDSALGLADKSEGVQDPLLTSHDTVVAETANVLFSGPISSSRRPATLCSRLTKPSSPTRRLPLNTSC